MGEALPRRDLYVVDPWGSDASPNSRSMWCIVKHPSCLSLRRVAAQSAAALSRLCLAAAVDGSGGSLQFGASVVVAIVHIFSRRPPQLQVNSAARLCDPRCPGVCSA